MRHGIRILVSVKIQRCFDVLNTLYLALFQVSNVIFMKAIYLFFHSYKIFLREVSLLPFSCSSFGISFLKPWLKKLLGNLQKKIE